MRHPDSFAGSPSTATPVALDASFSLALPGFRLEPQFTVAAELVAMFGPSGAGKSLSLRALAGLVHPDHGRIRLNGELLFDSQANVDLPPQQRRIGYVPQEYALFPHRTIAENIAFGLHKLPSRARQQRVDEMLTLMRLELLADRRPSEVSGGQKQRVALARALASRPRLLLMDEPFAAVEEELRAHLREELQRVQQHYRIPMILVTHNLAEAYTLADRLLVVDQGKVIQTGDRDEVFRRPATPKVARLMGMTNILDATVLERSSDSMLVEWHGLRFSILGANQAAPGGSLKIGLRPEELMVIRKQPLRRESWKENIFSARLIEDQPQGFDHLLTLEPDGASGAAARLQMRIPHPIFMRLELAIGEVRSIAVRGSSFHIFPNPD